jgi:response regulator of citrate/malate metabolism
MIKIYSTCDIKTIKERLNKDFIIYLHKKFYMKRGNEEIKNYFNKFLFNFIF